MLPELTERQEMILALVIHEYVDTAQPVGSKRLVSMFGLGVSPATVRNEMAALTEAGLLRQPHTSAGRVPTEEGYRYFVRRLLGETELPPHEKRTIRHQFHQARADLEEWMRLAASVLAHYTRVASLVTAPRPVKAVFKHLELIATHGRRVLMVLVLEGGEVRQQMLTLDEEVPQAQLSELADAITRASVGKDARAVAAEADKASGLAQQVLRLTADIMRHVDAVAAGEVYRDGLTNVLNQPEFADAERAQRALRLLEERSLLEQVLEKALSPAVGGVQVVIGGEGSLQELQNLSIVLTRYGAEGLATGALGVLGPTRMAYGRSISTVRYVARLMSDLIVESFAGETAVSEEANGSDGKRETSEQEA